MWYGSNISHHLCSSSYPYNKFSTNVIQIQYKCDTNKVQMWRKWNKNVIQVQYKYGTNRSLHLCFSTHPSNAPTTASISSLQFDNDDDDGNCEKGFQHNWDGFYRSEAGGKLFIFGTFSLSENAISKTLPHLKNRIGHPCLPSWRHPWIFSAQGSSLYYHLKIKESALCLRVFSGRLPFFWKAAFSFSRTSSRDLSPPGVIAFEQRKCLTKVNICVLFLSRPEDMAASTASCTCF